CRSHPCAERAHDRGRTSQPKYRPRPNHGAGHRICRWGRIMKSEFNLTDFAIRYGFLLLMAGLIIGFSIAQPAFLSARSADFIFQSVAITGILALGVTATLV